MYTASQTKFFARGIDRGRKERRTMANINVVNLGGNKVGEIELADEVFAGEINDALLWESVKHYRAALRQGTAATKNRKLVSGAGKKLWKQKGTGRARVGSSAPRSGVAVVLSMDLSPAAMSTPSRRRS